MLSTSHNLDPRHKAHRTRNPKVIGTAKALVETVEETVVNPEEDPP
jgi:hypothetical protein